MMIIDIAPKVLSYASIKALLLERLKSINFDIINTRKQAEEELQNNR